MDDSEIFNNTKILKRINCSVKVSLFTNYNKKHSYFQGINLGKSFTT